MKTKNSRSGTEIPVMSSYSALYHQVLTKINPIHARGGTGWDSPPKAKSQTVFGPRRRGRSSRHVLRASKSSEQPSRRDADPRLIPAIMAVERARVDLKVSPRSRLEGCGSASSSRSGEAAQRWGGKTRGGTDAAKYCVDIDLVTHTTESPPTDTTTESSVDLHLAVSEPSYSPSFLRTSEIPASPRGGATYRRPAHSAAKRPRPNEDARLLSLAERAVGRLLGAVLSLEAAQAAEREAIADPVERGVAEERDRRANDVIMRAWLAERGVWLGTVEAARFGAAWDEVRRRRGDATRRGISFGAWLSEKRDKSREEQAKEEALRREKEEADRVRREKAQQAYNKWCVEAASRPPLPQLVMYITERGTRKYVRRGSFCNPNPWVDILEEEQREKQKQQQEAASRRPCARSRPPPTRGGGVSSTLRPPPSRGGVVSAAGALFPLTVTRLGADGKRRRCSTYDSVVEFYTDLLRRCRPRGRKWGEVPVHGHAPSRRTPLPAEKPAHSRAHTPLSTEKPTRHAQQHSRSAVHAHTPLQAHTAAYIQEQIQAHEKLYAHMPIYNPGPLDTCGQVYAHAPMWTHNNTPIHTFQQGHSSEPIHVSRNLHTPDLMSNQVSGLMQAYMQVYNQEQVHTVWNGHGYVPVHNQEQVYATGPVPEQVCAYMPTYNYEEMRAHAPEHNHNMLVDTVHSIGQLYTPRPVHAPNPVYTSESQHGHMPAQAIEQLNETGLTQTVQQGQALKLVQAQDSVQAHKLVQAPMPIHARGPVHVTGPLYTPGPTQTVQEGQTFETVQAQDSVQAHKSVQARTPIHARGPVHVPGLLYAPGPTQTVQEGQTFKMVQAPVPIYAPGPVHAPGLVHALTPVHGRSMRKAQAAGL